MTKDKKHNQKSLEPEWQDRLLLESLVAQILPELITSEPAKADQVIAALKNDKLSLADFLITYPEYSALKINNRALIEKRFSHPSAKKTEGFFPLVNINHQILRYLCELIKERNILDIPEDKEYNYQLRVSLYNNFNRYLNLLLTKISAEDQLSLGQRLIGISDKDELLGVLANRLGQKPNEIINNFLNLGLK
ncbi:MAG: hypothetical protein WC467_04410 [Patescibacteria group bacterium]